VSAAAWVLMCGVGGSKF